jgi:excinuclease UvrABC ATPase subunit
MDRIEIVGGRIHNLKNIDLILPKNKIILSSSHRNAPSSRRRKAL